MKLLHWMFLGCLLSTSLHGHATSAPGRAVTTSQKSALSTDFRLDTASSVVNIALPAPVPRLKSGSDAGNKVEDVNAIGFGRNAELSHLAAESRAARWVNVDGGAVARFSVESPGAVGLRVGIRINTSVPDMEIRSNSSGNRSIGYEGMAVGAEWIAATYPDRASLIWTNWSYGSRQEIEVYVPGTALPDAGLVTVAGLSHGERDPWGLLPVIESKAVPLTCNLNFVCETNAVVQQAGRAVAKIIITDASGGMASCSGALINDTRSADVLFATAHHCGATTTATAASVQFHWNHETTCGGTSTNPNFVQATGAQLLHANSTNDFVLLRVTSGLPSGAFFLGWNANSVANGTGVFGIHHPQGATKKVSGGTIAARDFPVTFSNYRVNSLGVIWTAGITEQGSSGSALLDNNANYIGALSAGPLRQGEEYCTTNGPTRVAFYSQLSLVYPSIRRWLDPVTTFTDVAPANASQVTQTLAANSTVLEALNSPNDLDFFRINIPQTGVWLLFTERYDDTVAVDTFGQIVAANGVTVLAENDTDPTGLTSAGNFLFLVEATAGNFFVTVSSRNGATGAYTLNSVFVAKDDHYDIRTLGTQIQPTSTTAGTIETNGDADYFTFTLTAQTTLDISSTGNTDVMATLYSSTGAVLGENDDFGTTRNFRIISALPAGTYYLRVKGYDVAVTGAYSLQLATTTPGAPNYQGAWWGGVSENGWGLSLVMHGSTLVAGWYLYGSNGQPTWYIMPGCNWNANFTTCNGNAVAASGAWLGNYNTTALRETVVGSAVFNFTSTSAGTMTWIVNGVTVQKPISRIAFGSGSQPTSTNYTDVWWGGTAQNGWGIGVLQEGAQMVGSWYTYNQAGNPVWYLFNGGTWTNTTTYTAPLTRSTGSPMIGTTYNPNQLVTTNAGTITFSFTGASTGTITYTVDGVTQTKAIERIPF